MAGEKGRATHKGHSSIYALNIWVLGSRQGLAPEKYVLYHGTAPQIYTEERLCRNYYLRVFMCIIVHVWKSGKTCRISSLFAPCGVELRLPGLHYQAASSFFCWAISPASHQRTLKPGSTATVGVDDVDDDRSDCFYFRMTTLGYRVKHSETQLTYKDLSWLKGRNGLKK